MVTPAEISVKYAEVQPFLIPLQRYVRDTISPYCEERGFALVWRVKTLKSLCEKIETGRYSRWSDIDDLVAFAIVIPTLMDEEPVTKFLVDKFQKVALKARGSSLKAPNVFRFDSTRFVGRPQPLPEGSGARPIDQISFEIQVRSAFDHAWIVTTHALAYKANVIDWRQQRLAAELKATAEKMDLLILAFQEASVRVQESPWPEIQAKKDIFEYFHEAIAAHQLPQDLVPNDWSRFTENVYDLARKCDKRLRPPEIANLVVEAVKAELSRLGPDKAPLSLSLWQFTLASLDNAGALTRPLPEYWPLITTELETLYPGLRRINPRFELSPG